MTTEIHHAQRSMRIRLKGGRRSQRGATLLEAIAFLGIAAIVLVGAIALFTNAFQGARSNQLTEEVGALEQGVRKVYSQGAGLQANLAGGVAGLQAAGALPTTLPYDTTNKAVTNEWGGAVTVLWDATSSAAQIQFTKVPASACIAVLTAGGDWSEVGAAAGAGTPAMVTPPLTAAAATTACSGTDNTGNTVVWEFNS